MNMVRLFVFIASLLLGFSTLLHAQVGTPQSYKNAIVVSASEYASNAGRDIMKRGGNAFDAAVAVHFVLAVTHPAAGNIGGGGFMVARLADGTPLSLDFREKAPKRGSALQYLDAQGNLIHENALQNHLSAGIPGSVDAMLQIVDRYAKLPLDVLLAPAIKLAKNGYALRYEDAFLLNKYRNDFSRWPGSSVFIKPDGNLWEPGDILIQSDLAATLERIARNGRSGFYAGETAAYIASDMKANNGNIALDDLRDYRSVWRTPLTFSAFGYQFITMGPPSAGGITMQQILKMTENAGLAETRYGDPNAIHLLAEAMRRAYADRNQFLGDPDFIKNPVSEITDNGYLADRMKSFTPGKATPSSEITPGKVTSFQEPTETTHYSIIDKDGNAVSITTSLNSAFGNKIVVPRTGILLNNHIDDFSLKPGTPNQFGLVSSRTNQFKPGKRMLSSMTPTIVLKDGKITHILGASGGSTITTTVTQIFVYTALYGMNIQQAVSAPRFHHQWLPDQIFIEPFGIEESTKAALTSFGHQLVFRTSYIGRAECILVDENGKHGAMDPRGSDAVAGF
jgi:gamma-glutamyltranspeptidase/glutathione hydrolase